MNIRLLAPALVLPWALACNLTPKLEKPALPTPAKWEQGESGDFSPADLNWKTYFTDPGMRAIIELALAHNLDLKLAALNTEKAQAVFRIQRASLMPTVTAQGASTNYRISERQGNGESSVYRQSTAYVASLSWELDFFGRVRNLKDQALNQFLATEQAGLANRLAVVGNLAQAYLQYAADAELLSLAESTLDAQQMSCDLVAKTLDAGTASLLELKQAQSLVDSARGEVIRSKRLLALDKNALDLLAGTPVPVGMLPTSLSLIGDFRDVRAGLPSQVLLHRPDILMAEYQLKAANANIGAARAAFFPNISLTAGVGSMSPEVGNLFSAGTRTWLFTPSLSIPLFSGGALNANLQVAKVSREIAVADYQKAIQAGFRDVADGLAQRESLRQQWNIQQKLVQSLDETYRLSRMRFESGLDSYLAVLIAQRSLFSAQQGLVDLQLAKQSNQVTLYKALAGDV